MSNVIPPLLSSSPPPIGKAIDEEEEDEFGDFAVATNLSYGCDALSISPENQTNSTVDSIASPVTLATHKDYQDKRKSDTEQSNKISSDNDLPYSSSKIKSNVASKYNNFRYFPEVPPDIMPDDENSSDGDSDYIEPLDGINLTDEKLNVSIPDFVENPIKECCENVINEDVNFTEHQRCNGELLEAAESVNISDNNTTGGYLAAQESSRDYSDSNEIHRPEMCSFTVKSESKHTRQVDDFQDDDFGDFTDTPNENYTKNASDVDCNTTTNSEKNVEDYCDFKNHVGTQLNTNQLEDSTNDFESNSTPHNLEMKEDDFCAFDDYHVNKNDLEDKVDHVENQIAQKEEDQLEETDLKNYGALQNITKNEPEDDFGNFENAHGFKECLSLTENVQCSKGNQPEANQVTVTEVTELDDKFIDDDFGDFDSAMPEPLVQENDPFKNSEGPSDAGDFGNFKIQAFEELQKPISESERPPCQPNEDDDFGDFSDYSVHQTQSSEEDTRSRKTSQVELENIPLEAKSIVLDLFPPIEQPVEDYVQKNFTTNNVIFEALKDVTETCALSYQWSKSQSQSFLLKALNIDTRNILYGPRWNESMPRYAATLGFTPLEPVKTEILPTQPEDSCTSSQTPSTDAAPAEIPSAQFDWVGSGLTNPLEMTPKKVVERRAPEKSFKPNEPPALSADSKTTQENCIKPDFEFPPVLQPDMSTIQTSDNISVKSLQLNEIPEDSKTESAEFTDFTSFQAKTEDVPNWTFTAVPLRETHISSVQTELVANFEEPGWLKPTIVTPDLPRKSAVVNEEDDEEFTSFQSGESVVSDKNQSEEIKSELTPKPSSVLKAEETTPELKSKQVDDDDEFTEFQSTLPTVSLPVRQVLVPEPLKPAILEPLKPSVVQTAPSAINWPDPGLTDDDLMKLDYLSYKPKLLNNEPEPLSKEQKQEKPILNKTDDDEEWSDFVSPPIPTPSVKLSQVKQPSRTSTPELSLSVPQLHQVHPPKRPIPLVTPQGLQTKFVASSVQPSVQASKPYPQINHLQNGFQPSLISTQFAAHFEQGLGCYVQQKQPEVSKSKDDFEDEWTDFVSSQPAPTNGFNGVSQPKLNLDWNRPPQFNNWSTSLTPNIITNPVSFDSFHSYAPPAAEAKAKSRKNSNVIPKTNPISSISAVPDLDFIAPKSRTWKK